MTAYWPALIGASAILLLLVNGRIAGISGIVGGLLGGRQVLANGAFLAGLLLGPMLHELAFGRLPSVTVAASWPVVVLAGLLVGIGTRMGSGCTSGHGILGLARLSPRSIAATVTFMVTGIVTASAAGLFR